MTTNTTKWYFFTAQGNYSHVHNWSNDFASLNIAEAGHKPQDNEAFASLLQKTSTLFLDFTSYGGNNECWGYVLASSLPDAKNIIVKYSGLNFSSAQ